MNIIEFLFGFPVSGCNVLPSVCYVLVFCGCRWEFVPYSQMSGEQSLAWDCDTYELTISGIGGNTVDLSCLIPDCYSVPISRDDATRVLTINEGTSCEESVTIPLMIDVVYGGFYSDPSSLLPSLTDLIANSLLVEGMMYRITDFRTVHLFPYTSDVNSGAIEPIIVTALSSNTVSAIASTESFPDDIIYWDIDRDSVVLPSLTASWIAPAGPSVGDITIFVLAPLVFTIDVDLSTFPTWSFECTDMAVSTIIIDESSIPGVDYALIDIGGGTREITILGRAGDLFNIAPKPSTIAATIDQLASPRPGWIYRRINTTQNVDVPCDFRNVMQYRYLIDYSSIPVYDAIATYNRSDIVVLTNSIYVCTATGTVGLAPGVNTAEWIRIASAIDTYTRLPKKTTYGIAGELPEDITSQIATYMFESVPGVFNMSGINDFKIESLTTGGASFEIPNVNITYGATASSVYIKSALNITMIQATIHNTEIKEEFTDCLVFGQNLLNVQIGVECSQCTFDDLINVNLFMGPTQSNFARITGLISHGTLTQSFLTDFSGVNTFLGIVQNCTFANRAGNIVDDGANANVMIGFCIYNKFGTEFLNTLQRKNTILKDNNFGSRFGFVGSNIFEASVERCTFGGNTFSNNFKGPLTDCVFGRDLAGNTFAAQCIISNCKFDDYFANNTLDTVMQYCNFGYNCNGNTIPFTTPPLYCNFGNRLNGINFTPSTQLSGIYDKTIQRDNTGAFLRCTYLDATGNTVIVDALT